MSAQAHLMRNVLLVLAVALGAGCTHAPATGGRVAGSGSAPAAAKHPAATTSPPAGGPDSAQVVALLAGMQNAACPLSGVATGGQPDSSQLVALGNRGYHTVLDLRAAGEPRGMDEAAVARAAGLVYHTLPVTPATLIDSTFGAFRALAAGGKVRTFAQRRSRVSCVCSLRRLVAWWSRAGVSCTAMSERVPDGMLVGLYPAAEPRLFEQNLADVPAA